MYDNAFHGEKVVQIHLFGIKYAEDLAGLDIEAIVRVAGLRKSYITEVRKGMNLARHVTLKPGI